MKIQQSMNHLALWILVGIAINLYAADRSSADLQLEDEILVRISGSSGSTIIVTSDIKPALDGTPQTLPDLVMDCLMIQDAEKLHMQATPDDAARYVEKVMQQSGKTREELIADFEKAGYSYNQALDNLRRMQTQAQIFEYRIVNNPRTMVTAQEIETAYLQSVVLELCEVEISAQQLEGKDIASCSSDWLDQLPWSDSFLISPKDLVEERQSAQSKPEGSIVFVDDIEPDEDYPQGGFTLTRLVKKHAGILAPQDQTILTLSESRTMLEQQLRFDKIKKETRTYYQKIFDTSRMVFTYDKDRIEVQRHIAEHNPFGA